MRTSIGTTRRKLGNDAHNPCYIVTELCVGYRMPEGDESRTETPQWYLGASDGTANRAAGRFIEAPAQWLLRSEIGSWAALNVRCWMKGCPR